MVDVVIGGGGGVSLTTATDLTAVGPVFTGGTVSINNCGVDLGGARGIVWNLSNNLAVFKAARAQVQAGTGVARILPIGDSTTGGRGAGSLPTTGSPSYYYASEPLAYPARLAYWMNQAGTPAAHNTWLGDNGFGDAMLSDTRITGINGTSILRSTGVTKTLGGVGVTLNSAGGSFNFAPVDAFDTIDIYWLRRPVATANFTVAIDGGAAVQTINTGGGVATAYLPSKTTVTGISLGTHTVNLAYANNNSSFIQGIATRKSGSPVVSVYNAGVNGAVVGDFVVTTNGWEAPFEVTNIAPHLTIISTIINDTNAGTALATYEANLRSAVTNAKNAGSDVLLVVSHPVQGLGTGAYANWMQYEAVIYTVAESLGCGVLNLRMKYGSYENLVALGYSRDAAHMNDAGYDDMGHFLATTLLAA